MQKIINPEVGLSQEPLVMPAIRQGGNLQQSAVLPPVQPGQLQPQTSAALPNGQVINVSINSANPNLSFKEWMARGIVTGIGKVLAFPFRLVGLAAEKTVDAIVGILKWALIVVLIPTMIWLGIMLQQKLSTQPTTEAGAHQMMQEGKKALTGLKKGWEDDASEPTPSKQ